MEYKLTIPGGIDTALQELDRRMNTEVDGAVWKARSYVDTFDWRLYRAGLTAEIEDDPGGVRVVLRDLSDSTIRRSAVLDSRPIFAWDFTPGPMRNRFEDLLDERALLVQAHTNVHTRSVRFVNDDAKTVATIEIEHVLVSAAPGGGSDGRRRLGTIARAVPVRGYDRAAGAATSALEDDLGLTPCEPIALRAMRSAGRDPGGYSSKIDIELAHDTAAGDAYRQILRSFLTTLRMNLAGVRDDIDSEFLHDLRVTVRRARSLVAQAKGVLAPEIRKYMRDELRWIGTVTTPVRDLDVHLLELDSYRTPETPPSAIEELRAYLAKRKTEVHAELVEALDGPRFEQLVGSWQALVDGHDTGSTHSAPAADKPVVEVSRRRIWKMYKQLRTEGRAIDSESPDDDLHEARKTAKKLRYLLESFRSLYPADEISAVIKELKKIQDVLGEFQDTVAHAEELESIASDMSADRSASSTTMLAMGSMVDRMLERRAACRNDFYRRFEHFDRKKNRARFETLFRSDHARGAEAGVPVEEVGT